MVFAHEVLHAVQGILIHLIALRMGAEAADIAVQAGSYCFYSRPTFLLLPVSEARDMPRCRWW